MSPEYYSSTTPPGQQPGAAECEEHGIFGFFLRPLTILRGYQRADFPADLVAGLTVAAVAIPQAIAYASIAELPAHYGLYTAAVAAVIGSLWGCSRHLATGPVNATSLLVLPVLLAVAAPGTPLFWLAASTVALIVGVLDLTLAFLRFGALVTLASRSVLIGFTAGAAVHIAVGQVRHILGIDVPAMPELYRTASAIVGGVGATNIISLVLGLVTLGGVVFLKRLGHRVPAALLGIILAALVVRLFGLVDHDVRIVGAIPRSLPPPTWVATGLTPDLQLIRGLIVGSLAVAALGLIEAVAASQTLARHSGDRLDSNQEFFGQGLANIASGLLSGYPCSGSFTRSALAQQSGARTQITGVVTGLTILISMLIFAPWARYIPRAAIAGVLMVVAWGMVDRKGIVRVLRTSRSETAIMVCTFAATLVLPLDFAVLSGVVFSLAFFVIRSSLPRVFQVVPDSTFRHLVHDPSRPVCPQMGIMNIRGPLFFGAVYHLEEELRLNLQNHPGQNFLVLRMHGVDICDLSGIEVLESAVKMHRQLGGDVFLIRPREPVLDVMKNSGFLDDTLGPDHILEQEGAIEYLFDEVLDPSVCIYECPYRVFAECQALDKHHYEGIVPHVPRHDVIAKHVVSPERFQELASDPSALVIDIREPDEYRRGHIPGAGLLPLRMLPEKGKDLPRDRTILLACRSGRRSSRALTMLEELGFTEMYGMRGGILAWRAEGLPVTTPEFGEGEIPVLTDFSLAAKDQAFSAAVDTPDSSVAPVAADADVSGRLAPSGDKLQRRQTLTSLGMKTRIERLMEKLHKLSTTQDISFIQHTIESRLDRPPAQIPTTPGVMRLDPQLPVLVLSETHGMRTAFYKLLLDKYAGQATNLENLIQGEMQVLMLGDLLHTENEARWQAIEIEYAAAHEHRQKEPHENQRERLGPTPELDREMTDCLGLAAMVILLQRATPGFVCLKGNHDNILNSDEEGNAKLSKLVRWPGEGEVARNWTLARLGATFTGKYAAWESRLPLLAIYAREGDGLQFLASHSAPAKPYMLPEIESRSPEVVFGLTWTRNQGIYVQEVLHNIFGDDWPRARYFTSHAVSEEGLMQLPERNQIILNKSHYLVAALVRPGARDFEVHMVPG